MKHRKKLPYVKVYDGYGHSENIIVYGHVFKKKPHEAVHFKKNGLLYNLWHLVRLFHVKTLPYVKVKMEMGEHCVNGVTASDGFFKLELAPGHLSAGWHEVTVAYLDRKDTVLAKGKGKVFVPHVSQYAFISDIDDTIIRSFSAKIFKRLYELVSRNPSNRRLFDETARHYRLLATSFTEKTLTNPFFYVSSSEWNLYEYLRFVFDKHQLPHGIFLLHQIKTWKELASSGQTGHEGKFLRIVRVLKAFPRQRFILLGDNSQKDPVIYERIAALYPGQIAAVYIRNVRPSRAAATETLLLDIGKKGIPVCLFTDSRTAIEHGIATGLIEKPL